MAFENKWQRSCVYPYTHGKQQWAKKGFEEVGPVERGGQEPLLCASHWQCARRRHGKALLKISFLLSPHRGAFYEVKGVDFLGNFGQPANVRRSLPFTESQFGSLRPFPSAPASDRFIGSMFTTEQGAAWPGRGRSELRRWCQ